MIFALEDRFWDDGKFPVSFDSKHKGRAIDRMLRELTGSTSYMMEPYDLVYSMPELGLPLITHHEFKSTVGRTISISRMELDFAKRKYKEGNDVLYWIISQGLDSHTFQIKYLIRYSVLCERHLLHQSQFDSESAFFYADHCQTHGFEF